MRMNELIALASVRSGKKQKELAVEMGHNNATRLSRIRNGFLEADASEIVYLAHEAKLPEVKTLAEIEAERHPQLAAMWAKILKQNGTALEWLSHKAHHERRKLHRRAA